MRKPSLFLVSLLFATALFPSCKKENEPSKKTIAVESITLKKTELVLEIGETYTLKATLAPENATDATILWESDDEKIAAVDESGVITALAKGETVITASSASNPGVSASCAVKITKTVIPVQSVELNKTSLKMFAGKTYQLTATVKPEGATSKTLNWVSATPEVATVDGTGLVTALKDGTAKITATVSDAGDISATCDVTSYEVSLTKTSAIIAVKDTLLLSPYVKSSTIARSDISFVPESDADAAIAKVAPVSLLSLSTEGVVGVSAGNAKMVAKYTGKESMDTEPPLSFEVEVENTFLAYISEIFSIANTGTVVTVDEILSGAVAKGEKVKILQFSDALGNFIVTVSGIEMFKKQLDRVDAGDQNVSFLLGTAIEKTSIKRGSIIMSRDTKRMISTDKITGVLYIDGSVRKTPVPKGYEPNLAYGGSDMQITLTDLGVDDKGEPLEMLAVNEAHPGVKAEVKTFSGVKQRINCRIGQVVDVREGGRTLGKFLVTDCEASDITWTEPRIDGQYGGD